MFQVVAVVVVVALPLLMLLVKIVMMMLLLHAWLPHFGDTVVRYALLVLVLILLL